MGGTRVPKDEPGSNVSVSVSFFHGRPTFTSCLTCSSSASEENGKSSTGGDEHSAAGGLVIYCVCDINLCREQEEKEGEMAGEREGEGQGEQLWEERQDWLAIRGGAGGELEMRDDMAGDGDRRPCWIRVGVEVDVRECDSECMRPPPSSSSSSHLSSIFSSLPSPSTSSFCLFRTCCLLPLPPKNLLITSTFSVVHPSSPSPITFSAKGRRAS